MNTRGWWRKEVKLTGRKELRAAALALCGLLALQEKGVEVTREEIMVARNLLLDAADVKHKDQQHQDNMNELAGHMEKAES